MRLPLCQAKACTRGEARFGYLSALWPHVFQAHASLEDANVCTNVCQQPLSDPLKRRTDQEDPVWLMCMEGFLQRFPDPLPRAED